MTAVPFIMPANCTPTFFIINPAPPPLRTAAPHRRAVQQQSRKLSPFPKAQRLSNQASGLHHSLTSGQYCLPVIRAANAPKSYGTRRMAHIPTQSGKAVHEHVALTGHRSLYPLSIMPRLQSGIEFGLYPVSMSARQPSGGRSEPVLYSTALHLLL